MEAEHASLSCIIIDACGDPIAQVAYRCALCRKICDSTTDAMLHYQMEHVDLFAYNMQQQQQQLLTQSQHQRQANMVARGMASLNSSSAHLTQQHGSARQQFSPNATSSGSLLKRTASSNPSAGSLLKRPATASSGAGVGGGGSTSNSLLKRATNVMRAYQTTSNSTNSTSNSNRATSRRSNVGSSSGSGSTLMSNDVIDTIHRPYTTTSASRAAKRYAASSSDELNQNQDINNVTRSSSRNAAPRHVQRTNQYTANLKAKISAQKTAAASKEQQQDTQDQQQKQRPQQQQHLQQQQQNTTPSTPLSSQSSSVAQVSHQQSDSDTPLGSSGSSVTPKTPTSTANDTTDSASMISTKQQSIPSSQSPGSRDSSKSYSLRPRSSGKKSFRIS